MNLEELQVLEQQADAVAMAWLDKVRYLGGVTVIRQYPTRFM